VLRTGLGNFFIAWLSDCFMVRDFKRLDIWKLSIELSKKIYEASRKFPKEEIYGMTSQLRRAVVSIFSNIAEGCGRRTSRDFVQFLYNAMGSVREVESQLIFAENLGYLKKNELEVLMDSLDRLGKMLTEFIKHVFGLGVR